LRISPEKLAAEAESTGFRPDVIEKVAHLLGLLDSLRSHPFLKGKFVLKGGTALNLFVFDVPRLSVDIDLNYVGAESRQAMLQERPKVEQAVEAVFSREGFSVRRSPTEHAGGKWLLQYPRASGQTGNLEVDINFMFRIPLWPTTTLDSRPVGTWRVTGIPVQEIHELAGGKLSALMSRRQARDLFDCHRILRMHDLDRSRLRIAFVVYGAMNRKDWRTVSVNDVAFDATELAGQLLPTLRLGAMQGRGTSTEYSRQLVEECQQALFKVLPFTDAEQRFLDRLLDKGEIDSAILTDDVTLQDRIQRHPNLEWKAINVRRHKGLP
jgi:predicted nucleotidyltransferase component of viral defense system